MNVQNTGDCCSSCNYWNGSSCRICYGMKSYQWCTMFISRCGAINISRGTILADQTGKE